VNRKSSRVVFIFGVIGALIVTGVTLYSLAADYSAMQTTILMLGCLVVAFAIIFSFLEVRRIAHRSNSIGGEISGVDPDGPRKIIVEPPTGEATPHHEFHEGSRGLDQGQLTSRLSGTPRFAELFHWGRHKRRAS
jgi:hypothetical protein